MANYIASYTKKKVRLERLEKELSRSVQSGESAREQFRLAEEVRLARIGALRAARAALKPAAGSKENRGVTLEKKIAVAERATPESILLEVRKLL